MDKNRLQTLVLAVALTMLPASAYAAKVEENPTAGEMATDLIIARPVGLAVFALGSAAFVATLPFSLLGGNMSESGKTLVVNPAQEVFVRCLGCRRSGRKEQITD